MKSEQLTDFLELSAALTGVQALNLAAGKKHLSIQVSFQNDRLNEILERWRSRDPLQDVDMWISELLSNAPALRAVCEDIVMSWMFGSAYRNGIPTAAPMHSSQLTSLWFGGVFWQIAKSHPPGLSGGYFGHWSYPAEN